MTVSRRLSHKDWLAWFSKNKDAQELGPLFMREHFPGLVDHDIEHLDKAQTIAWIESRYVESKH
jgi:hypothetical protein